MPEPSYPASVTPDLAILQPILHLAAGVLFLCFNHPCSLVLQSCSKAYTAPKAPYWPIPLCLPPIQNALLSSAWQLNFDNERKFHFCKTLLFPSPLRGSDPSIFCPQRYNYKLSIIFMLLWVIRQSSCCMGQPSYHLQNIWHVVGVQRSLPRWTNELCRVKAIAFVHLVISWYLTWLEKYGLDPFIKFYLYLPVLLEKLLQGETMVYAIVIPLFKRTPAHQGMS